MLYASSHTMVDRNLPCAYGAPGAVLAGRYRLGPQQRRDACSVVVQAWDIESRFHTSLELFDPLTFPNHEEARGLLRESAAITRVRHANVSRVLSMGRCKHTGIWYRELETSAEYEAGQRLMGRTLAACAPQDLRAALKIVIQAARGLEFAHSLGVYHMSLRPHSILVRPLTRRAQVVDFGPEMARFRVAAEVQVRRETRHTSSPTSGPVDSTANWGAGRPYRAPEQLRTGSWVPPGTQANTAASSKRVDVYGLAAILHHFVCGMPPTIAATIHPRAEERLADETERAANAAPSSMSTQRLIWTDRAPPQQLCRIIERGLAPDPASRYATCAELATDLEAFLAQVPASTDRGRPMVQAMLALARWRPILKRGIRHLALAAAVLTALYGFARISAQRDVLAHEQWKLRQVQKEIAGEVTPRSLSKATAGLP